MASIPLLIAYVAGQHRIMPPRIAAGYAVLFATGLFLSIVIIGTVCALLGRMLGDIGPYWQIGVGLLLVWVGYTFLRPAVCSTTGGVMQRFQVKGLPVIQSAMELLHSYLIDFCRWVHCF